MLLLPDKLPCDLSVEVHSSTKNLGVMQKLEILTDAAKYDVACTSSGVDRKGVKGKIGNAAAAGICHSFSADGRCISLLKVLMSNACVYDCVYCVNKKSNSTRRTTFTPEELAKLTMDFYRRNYIEGLFLSSAVVKNPDYSCELMLKTLTLLREDYNFNGYIHVKAIPGADERLIQRLGLLADRMSVNIEFPSNESLISLAPQKTKKDIFTPMTKIRDEIKQNSKDLVRYKKAPSFVSGGQSTQMIIGASPETDYKILKLSEGLYKKYELKRVFFSAYMPVVKDEKLPALTTAPPLLREHRLYQADWLLRFYKFQADEILSEKNPDFNPVLDPKCNWAVNNMQEFPVEVNKASFEMLLRVPGIGVISAKRIIKARRYCAIDFEGLKKLGVVLKRAKFFITCKGKFQPNRFFDDKNILTGLLKDGALAPKFESGEQLSLFNLSTANMQKAQM